MNKTRLLVADDHIVVRKGLRQIVTLAPDIDIVEEAGDGWEVLKKIGSEDFDLLLMDVTMPGPNGIELVKRVKNEKPKLAILVLSMHNESQIAARLLKAGATGYITKDSNPIELLTAIRQVARGDRYIEPRLAVKMVFDTHVDHEEYPHQRLSDREYQVFLRLAHGQQVTEIANQMHVSAKTISTHKLRLMKKLGTHTIGDLVRYAIKHHLAE